MPWKLFDPSQDVYRRGRSRSDVPMVSISPAGMFLFNVAAYQLLSKPAAVHVLYDAEDRRVGFRAAKAGDPNAYKVGKSVLSVSGKALLKTYGIPHEMTRRYQAKTQGEIVFIKLGEGSGAR